MRLALGATARRLIGQFVGEHLLVVGVGALAGWLLASRVVVDLLTAPLDVAVFAGVPAMLLAVAVAASWWPARRVARRSDARAARGVSRGSGTTSLSGCRARGHGPWGPLSPVGLRAGGGSQPDSEAFTRPLAPCPRRRSEPSTNERARRRVQDLGMA